MAGNHLLHTAPGVPQNRTAFFKKVHLASFHFDIKENLLFKAGETAQQVKALVCSYRRPGFSSQHPHGE